jgi:hypothetical protein
MSSMHFSGARVAGSLLGGRLPGHDAGDENRVQVAR